MKRPKAPSIFPLPRTTRGEAQYTTRSPLVPLIIPPAYRTMDYQRIATMLKSRYRATPNGVAQNIETRLIRAAYYAARDPNNPSGPFLCCRPVDEMGNSALHLVAASVIWFHHAIPVLNDGCVLSLGKLSLAGR